MTKRAKKQQRRWQKKGGGGMGTTFGSVLERSERAAVHVALKMQKMRCSGLNAAFTSIVFCAKACRASLLLVGNVA